jgi:hypothetical protein
MSELHTLPTQGQDSNPRVDDPDGAWQVKQYGLPGTRGNGAAGV